MESDDEFIEYEIEVVGSPPPPAEKQEKSFGECQSVGDTTTKSRAKSAADQPVETSAGQMAEQKATATQETMPQTHRETEKWSGKGQAVLAQNPVELPADNNKGENSSPEKASPTVVERQQVKKRPTAAESVAKQSNRPSIDNAINDDAIVSKQEAPDDEASVRAGAGRRTSTSGAIEPAEQSTSSLTAITASTTATATSTATINDLSVAGKVKQIPMNETSNSRQESGEANNKCQVEPKNDRNDLMKTPKEDGSKNNEQECSSTPKVNTSNEADESTDNVISEDKTAIAEPATTEIFVTTTENKQLLSASSSTGGSQASASDAAGDEIPTSQAAAAASNEEQPPLLAAAAAANHQGGSSSKAAEQAEACEGQPVEQLREAEWRFIREPYRIEFEPARRAELLVRLGRSQATGALSHIRKAVESTAVVAREEQVAELETTPTTKVTDDSLPSEQQDDDDPKRVSISIEGADGEAAVEACAVATKFSASMTIPAGGDETPSDDLEWEFDNEPAFEKRQVEIKRNCDPRNEYELGDELGRGKFGTVYRCVEQSSGRKLAAKFVLMRRREDREDVEREIDIMSCLQHKRLLQLYDAFDDGRDEMCLITELVEGGELFERIIDDDFELTEKKAAIFMRQICEGIEYMHGQKIVHLDMKPENILCLSKTGNRIKLIDFGLARKLVPGEQLRVMFGTPDFAAPEVLSYDIVTPATDMWSIGVICYVLLSGLSPFMGDSDMETMANVTRATYDFEDPAFEPISDLAKDFIFKLLVREPERRLKPGECLKHDWLQRGGRQLEASVRRASIAMLVSSGGLLEQQLASLSAVVAATATAAPISVPPTGVQFASSSCLDSLTSPAIMLLGGGIPPASLFSLDKRNLKKYVVRRKWHKTVHAIMALGRMGANLRLKISG